jgi:hypothetical protein
MWASDLGAQFARFPRLKRRHEDLRQRFPRNKRSQRSGFNPHQRPRRPVCSFVMHRDSNANRVCCQIMKRYFRSSQTQFSRAPGTDAELRPSLDDNHRITFRRCLGAGSDARRARVLMAALAPPAVQSTRVVPRFPCTSRILLRQQYYGFITSLTYTKMVERSGKSLKAMAQASRVAGWQHCISQPLISSSLR